MKNKLIKFNTILINIDNIKDINYRSTIIDIELNNGEVHTEDFLTTGMCDKMYQYYKYYDTHSYCDKFLPFNGILYSLDEIVSIEIDDELISLKLKLNSNKDYDYRIVSEKYNCYEDISVIYNYIIYILEYYRNYKPNDYNDYVRFNNRLIDTKYITKYDLQNDSVFLFFNDGIKTEILTEYFINNQLATSRYDFLKYYDNDKYIFFGGSHINKNSIVNITKDQSRTDIKMINGKIYTEFDFVDKSILKYLYSKVSQVNTNFTKGFNQK